MTTVAELEQLRADAIAADPLKPGTWAFDGRMGRCHDEDDAIVRADAKFCNAAERSDEAVRYARAVRVQRDGGWRK